MFSQTLTGQNKCGDFKDYKASQNWVQKLRSFEPEQRKFEILKRIKCEQESEPSEIDFWLTIIIDAAIVSTANEIPIDQNKILELIPASSYKIGHSLCETDGIYPQKCNLGFVLINGLTKPLLNEITEIQNIHLNRKKGKIIIKLESEIENDIEFELNHFLKGHSTRLTVKTELKKGSNRFVFKRSNNVQLVEAVLNGKKLIIII